MVKAAVLGAAGGIGQPLSMLMKTCSLIDELALYDLVNTPGVAADLSHIPTITSVTGYLPKNNGLKQTLTDADIVVIPAGVPRRPGMTCRDDLFRLNAGTVHSLAEAIADHCPQAFVLVITNPVNSTLPIVAEVLRRREVFDARKLFGVTTLDVIRAQSFLGPYTGELDPNDIVVPVVGGHSNESIVPLFSMAQPSVDLPQEKVDALTHRVKYGGEEVVQAKGGFNSATLSMAAAAFRLVEAVLRAARGEEGIVEPTFAYVADIPGGQDIVDATNVAFFAAPVEFDKNGAAFIQNLLPHVSEYERNLLEESTGVLRKNIVKGITFAREQIPVPTLEYAHL